MSPAAGRVGAAMLLLAAGAGGATAADERAAPPPVALELTVAPAAPTAGAAAVARLRLLPPAGWRLVETTPLHVAVRTDGPWRAERSALAAADAVALDGQEGRGLAVPLRALEAGEATVCLQASYFLCQGRRCRRGIGEQTAKVTISAGALTPPP